MKSRFIKITASILVSLSVACFSAASLLVPDDAAAATMTEKKLNMDSVKSEDKQPPSKN